jgi:catechol 2,3-dioxygenase-like lactoylglutathione lyase family enzyme
MFIRGGFRHVHLISEDPKATADWYVKALGAEIAGSEERRGSWNVTMRLGEADLRVRKTRETDDISASNEGRSPGIHHFALTVGDLKGVIRRVEDAGGKLAEPVFTSASGNLIGFVLAPDDVLVELIQPSDA